MLYLVSMKKKSIKLKHSKQWHKDHIAKEGDLEIGAGKMPLKKAVSRKKVPKIPYSALKKLLKSVLDSSYNGCIDKDGCIYCGSINADVCEFIDKYIHKRKLPKCCASCAHWGSRGECELTRKEVGGAQSVSYHLGQYSCRLWMKPKKLNDKYKELITGALP